MRDALARDAPRPSSPSRRSSTARWSRARPSAFMAWAGQPRDRRRRRRRATAGCSTAWSPTSAATGPLPVAAHRHAHGRRRRARAARGGARRCASREALRAHEAPMRTVAVLPVKRFATPSSAWPTALGAGHAARARRGDGHATSSPRCARVRGLDEVRRRHRRAAAPRRSRCGDGARVVPDPSEAGQSPRPRARASTGPWSAAPTACCSSRATARRSTPRELDALLRRRARRRRRS